MYVKKYMDDSKYACKYCSAYFKHATAKYRHEKHRCKKRNIKIIQQDVQVSTVHKNIEDKQLTLETSELCEVPSEKLMDNNIVKINYVLPKQNYWEMLKEKKGVAGALQFLHRCADLKVGGDVLLFEELFLPQDNRASWPIERKKGCKELILKEPDGTIIDEYAGRIIYDRFVINYKDALLSGSNQILSILVEPDKVIYEIEKETKSKVTKPSLTDDIRAIRAISSASDEEISRSLETHKMSSSDLESAYTSIFIEYDFGKFQERAYNVQHEHPKPHGKFSDGILKSNFS